MSINTILKRQGAEHRSKANNLLAPPAERAFYEHVADVFDFAYMLMHSPSFFSPEKTLTMLQGLKIIADARDQNVPRFHGASEGYRMVIETMENEI